MRDADLKAGPLPAEVLRWWKQKKLKPTFDYRETWMEEHSYAFSVAKVMRRDVLQAMHEELARAIAEGVGIDKWTKQVEPRFKQMGWWGDQEVEDPETGQVVTINAPSRLRLIFNTNMRMAHAAGQWDRIQRNKRYRPYLLYYIGPAIRHREQHVAWNGVLLPVDDDFWSYAMPMNGWNCHCGVRSVTEREARELEDTGVPAHDALPEVDENGVPTGHLSEADTVPVQRTAPKLEWKPWENKRSGKIEMVPEGIDPGFQYLPSIARTRWLDAAAAE
jgi:uncharacterized protein with gpF-like domain